LCLPSFPFLDLFFAGCPRKVAITSVSNVTSSSFDLEVCFFWGTRCPCTSCTFTVLALLRISKISSPTSASVPFFQFVPSPFESTQKKFHFAPFPLHLSLSSSSPLLEAVTFLPPCNGYLRPSRSPSPRSSVWFSSPVAPLLFRLKIPPRGPSVSVTPFQKRTLMRRLFMLFLFMASLSYRFPFTRESQSIIFLFPFFHFSFFEAFL